MGLDDADLPAAVGQIQKSFIPKLKLAFIGVGLGVPVRKQIGLSQRRVGLQAQLGGGHHGPQEGLRRRLRQLWVGRQRGEHDPGEPLRGHHTGQRLFDLPAHLLDVLLECRPPLQCRGTAGCSLNGFFRCHRNSLLSVRYLTGSRAVILSRRMWPSMILPQLFSR